MRVLTVERLQPLQDLDVDDAGELPLLVGARGAGSPLVHRHRRSEKVSSVCGVLFCAHRSLVGLLQHARHLSLKHLPLVLQEGSDCCLVHDVLSPLRCARRGYPPASGGLDSWVELRGGPRSSAGPPARLGPRSLAARVTQLHGAPGLARSCEPRPGQTACVACSGATHTMPRTVAANQSETARSATML
jgi:hypothetical protein